MKATCELIANSIESNIAIPLIPKPVVFVSSTIENLPTERAAAKKAIESLNLSPSMSEYTFEAINKNSIDTCIKKVKKADIYILMLGSTYGWELPSGISITEFEFDTAYKEGKSIFVFNLPYKKEAKQKIFEKKVGSLFFYKKVKDVYELEKNIIEAIQGHLEEVNFNKKSKTEKIYSNLVEVSFPEYLFIANLAIDRNEVIKNSWQTDKPLTNQASIREVIYSALKQKQVFTGSDWHAYENKIITFYDLNRESNHFRKIINIDSIRRLTSKEFYSAPSDYQSVFKSLLHHCLQRKAFSLHINWHHELKFFYFMPEKDEDLKRAETWHNKINATRTVYEAKFKRKKPDEFFYGKHLAFRGRFYCFNDNWYLKISPDWYISWKDFKKSFYSYQTVTYLKRKERNNQVFNHFKFIVFIIKNRNERVENAVELYYQQIDFLATHRNVDVIICLIPKSFDNKIIKDKDTELEETLEESEDDLYEFNFRRAIKARIMHLNKPIQLIREHSLIGGKGRQDDATRAWNFCTALYYKASNTTVPWRLIKEENKPPVCFVGISFYKSRDRQTIQTSLAQLFDEYGNGVILRGSPVDKKKDDLQHHLNEEQAYSLLTEALEEYRFVMKNFPARLVLHCISLPILTNWNTVVSRMLQGKREFQRLISLQSLTVSYDSPVTLYILPNEDQFFSFRMIC